MSTHRSSWCYLLMGVHDRVPLAACEHEIPVGRGPWSLDPLHPPTDMDMDADEDEDEDGAKEEEEEEQRPAHDSMTYSAIE